MNYNYSNFTNPEQYISYGKNLPSKLYNSNPKENIVPKNIINKSDNKINIINNNENYNNNFTPISFNKKKKVNKKKVKFNDKVCVIKIESYKEFNKIDDNPNLNKVYNNNYNTYYNNNDQNKSDQKTKNCECHIM